MIKVNDQYSSQNENTSKMIKVHHGECSRCGTVVTRSKYGRDDECPECGAWLDWQEK